MPFASERIAVLGAGLQGSCIAFELAARGACVDLYERNATCVAEASACNEGKIHLGYVYAHDETLRTARLMAEGALCFEALLRRWLGDGHRGLVPSSPFRYVVHRDSLITPEEFGAYAGAVAEMITERSGRSGSGYFGRPPGRPPQRLADWPDDDPGTIAAVFATEEIAIDPEDLAVAVRARIESEPEIRLLASREVVSVGERSGALTVRSRRGKDEDAEGYDYVVNALGTGRVAIDLGLGIKPPRPWLYRFKYFLRGEVDPEAYLPSTTMVLGPFGDIVRHMSNMAYLSWYPAGLAGWSTDARPPPMPTVLCGAEADRIGNGILDGLATVVPEVTRIALGEPAVKGGWIYALGKTDIDDPASELHQRTGPGIVRHGRYLTVDTGKFTLAPLFAECVVEMLRA